MKTRTIIAIVVASACMMLNACSMGIPASIDTPTGSTVTTQTRGTLGHDFDTDDFSNAEFVSEGQALFYQAISDNSIDRAYYEEKVGCSTIEMERNELKYAEIWKAELDKTIDSFVSLLNEEQKIQFMKIQSEWENCVIAEREFIQNFSVEGNYKTHFGSMFLVECANKYREDIRERTLYIKYLQFCIEDIVVFHTAQ